jgi:hypothetical protein
MDTTTRQTEPAPLEPHFTPQQIAKIWLIDASTVRRMFIDEPGVFRIGKTCRRDGKRDYTTMRIPGSVMERVYRRRIGVQ